MVKWTGYTDRAKSNRIPQQIERRLETASLLDPVSSYETNDNLIWASQQLNFAIMWPMRQSPSGADPGTPFCARTAAGGMVRSRLFCCVFEISLAQCKCVCVLGTALFRLDDF